MTLRMEALENIVRKGENAGNQHFLLFPHSVFYSIKGRNHHYSNSSFVVCKCFQFAPVQRFVVWKRVKTKPGCIIRTGLVIGHAAKGLIAKNIDWGQPARTAQADLVDAFCRRINLTRLPGYD